EIIVKAIRLCKFHFSIARAIMKPPINRKIVSSPYDDVVAPMSNPFVNGNRIIGSREVAGIGIASVIHQMAIQIVLASTAWPSEDRPSGEKNINVKIKNNGPAISPINCAGL